VDRPPWIFFLAAFCCALALPSSSVRAQENDCGLEPPGSVDAPPVERKPFEQPFRKGEPPLVRREISASAPVGRAALTPLRVRTGALSGKSVYISAGHGFTWTESLNAWRTQRGNTNQIVEDLVSIETNNQFLVPMLLALGAHVVTVRELAQPADGNRRQRRPRRRVLGKRTAAALRVLISCRLGRAEPSDGERHQSIRSG